MYINKKAYALSIIVFTCIQFAAASSLTSKELLGSPNSNNNSLALNPTVHAVTPTNEDKNAFSNAVITITFSEMVYPIIINEFKNLADNSTNSFSNPIFGITIVDTETSIPVPSVNATLTDSTITLSNPTLTIGSTYIITVPAGVVENSSLISNLLYSWTISILNDPPGAAHLEPFDGETGVELDVTVGLLFDMPVTEVYLEGITIVDGNNNILDNTSPLLSNGMLFINHDDFEYNTTYTVNIPSYVVKNEDDVENKPISWSFTTLLAPPTVATLSPVPNATGVALDADITIEFEEDVFELTADKSINQQSLFNILIYDADLHTVSNVNANLMGRELTITHDDFEPGTYYTVTIPASSLVNSEGTPNGQIEWSFTTITSAPQPIAYLPDQDATGVQIDATITITFDMPISAVSMSSLELITITETISQTILNGVEATVDGYSLLINHDGLDYGTQYTVTIPSATVQNLDVLFNDEISWSFTTINISPQVIEFFPANNSNRVALDAVLHADFNLPISLISTNGLDDINIIDGNLNQVSGVTASLSGSRVTIEHDNFEYATYYTATIPAGTFQNIDGVPNGEEQWHFTTILSAPVPITFIPADNATEVALDSPISLEFNMSISSISSSTLGLVTVTNTISQSELTGITVSVDGSTLTITHPDLEGGSEYLVSIPAGVVENLDFVSNNDISWTFSTADLIEPPLIVDLFYPSFGAVLVELNPVFEWFERPFAENYDFQLAFDMNFSQVYHEAFDLPLAVTYQLPDELPPNTLFYWRVRAKNSSAEGPWNSVPFSFTTTMGLPGIVELLTPGINDTNVDVLPTLSWVRGPFMNSFDVYLSDSETFEGEPMLSEYDSDSYSFATRLATETDYYWRIRARNVIGIGEFSPVYKFTTIPTQIPFNPTNLVITVPKLLPSNNNYLQNTGSFILNWDAPEWDGGAPITNYLIQSREQNQSNWMTYEREASTETTAILDGFIYGVSYEFRVAAVNRIGVSNFSDTPPAATNIENFDLPASYVLEQNYPNPFNPTTIIKYAIPDVTDVKIEIFSMLGQLLITINEGVKPPGWHDVQIQADGLSSGTYIYRIQAGSFVSTRKMMFLK